MQHPTRLNKLAWKGFTVKKHGRLKKDKRRIFWGYENLTLHPFMLFALIYKLRPVLNVLETMDDYVFSAEPILQRYSDWVACIRDARAYKS